MSVTQIAVGVTIGTPNTAGQVPITTVGIQASISAAGAAVSALVTEVTNAGSATATVLTDCLGTESIAATAVA